jgi:hypothetical protein
LNRAVRWNGIKYAWTDPDWGTLIWLAMILRPNTITQRYDRLARRLDIDTHFHAPG